ncbi:hypothetical protein [Nocardia pseudobrasiliensis]|uniref:Secreted protein n=1 Tax=Nocardia pseudobrasiliensis TaxID=45979 RepID=A0A370ICL8_9NOCA|nr:hypothetical protein [Nocardia pseudobrasiliensis]RDI68472.1 hypothetical protein DFR76_1017 [Nocardia pseudobrasiliensis]
MFGKLSRVRAALIAVSCTAAAMAVGAGPARAEDSTTVSPAGAGVATANMGPVVFGTGISKTTCYTAISSGGSVPAAPNNKNTSGPVIVSLGPLALSKCDFDEPDRTVKTTGIWGMAAQNGSPIAADLIIPQGGVTTTTGGAANCTTVYAPDGPATVSGTYTNSVDNGGLKSLPTMTVLDYVPTRRSGDASCPTGNSWETVSATLIVNNPTDQGHMITVGP